MAITAGYPNNPLKTLDNGAPSTWFTAGLDPQAARKRWIAAMKARGTVTVDAGAVDALRNGKSLLPAGVVNVAGDFGRGDPVEILNSEAVKIGQGLTRYTASESLSIMGCRSTDIEAMLGYPGRAALIHRDDMAL